MKDYNVYELDVSSVYSFYRNLKDEGQKKWQVTKRGRGYVVTSVQGTGGYILKGKKQTIELYKKTVGEKEVVSMEDIDRFIAVFTEGFLVYALVQRPSELLEGEEKEDYKAVLHELIHVIYKAGATYDKIEGAAEEYIEKIRKNVDTKKHEDLDFELAQVKSRMKLLKDTLKGVEMIPKRLCNELDVARRQFFR